MYFITVFNDLWYYVVMGRRYKNFTANTSFIESIRISFIVNDVGLIVTIISKYHDDYRFYIFSTIMVKKKRILCQIRVFFLCYYYNLFCYNSRGINIFFSARHQNNRYATRTGSHSYVCARMYLYWNICIFFLS